ncbi:hypothetical protein [Achromobacter agilis]|uniref:Tetratricopeptide repeat protein n=1 Tax=Achromobacter agilis TaxID=1353888 RepID=A0A446CNL7_9BURK|nr:hypothetical protein [Achromobacter agilis]SSW69556.1 hypothetical protein AGI3411_04246 [Achromobacter agilis]
MTSVFRPLRAGRALAAAAFLSMMAVPAAAQETAAAAQAQAPLSPFMRHMEAARGQIRDASWSAATDSARAALEAARLNRNRYEIFDAAVLLLNLLQKQGRHADARNVAEAQVEDFGRLGDDDGMAIMLSRAIEAGVAAGEASDVTRLQARLIELAKPYPALWDAGSGQRLRYAPAGLSLPLAQDGWALLRFEPADARNGTARLDYARRLDERGRVVLQLGIGYLEALRGLDGAQRQALLKGMQGEPYGEQTAAPAVAAALPDLPFKGLVQAKAALRSGGKGNGVIDAEWVAARGDWRLKVQASYPEAAQAEALKQVQALLGAMSWDQERRLFREQTMAAQAEAINAEWAMAGDWAAAAKLAQAALPDATFPLEIARMNTVMASAAYERGALDEARSQYDAGLAAWAYAGKAYHDETLYETALDRAADTAYRQGRESEAVALNKRFIDWVGDRDQAWTLPEGRAQLESGRTGQVLPLRVGDFRLKPIGEKRFQYEDLKTGELLGLSVEQRAGIDDDALERSMRAFMRDKLGLEAGAMQASAFVPRAREGGTGPLQGRKWAFEVAAGQDDGRTLRLDGRSRGGAPARMVFWIVDRGDSRSILRAPLTADSDGNARIEQVAQALAW